MRHRVAGYKLSRDSEQRWSDRRNLAIALFTHGQITTTLPKAKMVQPFVEKIITDARTGTLAARRRVTAQLGRDQIVVKNDKDESVKRNSFGEIIGGQRIVKKLFEEIAPKFAQRPGGYTRVVKLAKHRVGDGSSLVVLQLVSDEDGGPQVAGQFSRRREKANRRMEFAAKLRKGGDKAAAATSEAPAVETAPATDAPAPAAPTSEEPKQG